MWCRISWKTTEVSPTYISLRADNPIVPNGFIVDFDYWLNCFLDAHASSGSQNPTQDSDLSQVTVTKVFCILRTRRIISWLA